MDKNFDVIQWLDSRLSQTIQFFAQEEVELNKYGYIAACRDLNVLANLLIKATDIDISNDSDVSEYETQCIAISMNIENEEEYNSEEAMGALSRYAAELQRILHTSI